MKICSKCDEKKESSEFYAKMAKCKKCHNKVARDWQKRNKTRMAEIARDWYNRKPENRQYAIQKARDWQKANRERDKLRKFHYNMERLYGLTSDKYYAMVESQGGVCAICKQKPYRNFDVDHCHVTSKVRGLLCSNCNTALGLLKDDKELFASAIEYLDCHPTD